MITSFEIELSFIDDYLSLEEALVVGLRFSKGHIKKFRLSKKFLKRKVLARSSYKLPLDLLNTNIINGDYEGNAIAILYEDENFLVLNKPTFVHSHPLKYSDVTNTLSFLRQKKYHHSLKVNQDHYDRGLLYRLDFETSGVLIYIKNEELYQKLRENFKAVAKEKIYLCIVCGNCLVSGPVTHTLIPSEKKGKKMKMGAPRNFRQPDKDGIEEEAFLEIRKLSYNEENNLTLLEIKLQTGQRHQIRAQLSFIGHPILGDELYGGASEKRMYLHAYRYSLEWEQGKKQFQSLIPQNFLDFFPQFPQVIIHDDRQ